MIEHAVSQTQALPDEKRRLIRNLIVFGTIAGILADIADASAIAPVPLPDQVKVYLGMAFGPLLAPAFIALYHFFRLHRNSVLLQAGTLYAIIAGVLVNIMIVVVVTTGGGHVSETFDDHWDLLCTVDQGGRGCHPRE